MKLVKNNKLFVDLTNIMVVHIKNNEIGCFNQFVLREYNRIIINTVKDRQASQAFTLKHFCQIYCTKSLVSLF